MPEFGQYATGIFYLDNNQHVEAEKEFDTLAASLGIKVICWRDVPTNSLAIGTVARKSEPVSRQVFVTADLDQETLKKQVTFNFDGNIGLDRLILLSNSDKNFCCCCCLFLFCVWCNYN